MNNYFLTVKFDTNCRPFATWLWILTHSSILESNKSFLSVTASYGILPLLTASYCILPLFTD